MLFAVRTVAGAMVSPSLARYLQVLFPIPLSSFAAQQICLLQLLADRVFGIDTSRAVVHSKRKTPEETPDNNPAKNRVCQRTPPDSAGFFIMWPPRASNGPFRGMAYSFAWRCPPDLVDGRARIMIGAPVLGLPTGPELPSVNVLAGDEEGFPDVAHGDRCHR
jgi:hypothetical protein